MIVSSPGTRLAKVSGRYFLFSPKRQLLFAAEPIVAGLWSDLERGMSEQAFVSLAASGDGNGARVLSELTEAGLLDIIAPSSGTVDIASSFCLRLDDVLIGLHTTGSRMAMSIRETWGYLEVPWERCDEHLVIIEETDSVGLAYPDEEPEWFGWTEIAAAIKIRLTDIVLEACDELVLHVATLTAEDRALLLCGEPGDGKSTLSVALDAGGAFRLEGDDLAVMTPDGQVRAIPFPATLKSGAWPLLEGDRPDILDRETYTRPDNQIVRYLPLPHATAPWPRPVACVLCLDRSPYADPKLETMTADAAIGALLRGGWSQDRRLSPEAFEAVATCVDGACFFRMSYTELGEALFLVRQAWCAVAETQSWSA